jgi:hypothetical protein
MIPRSFATDLHRKGYETRIIVEGMATRLLANLEQRFKLHFLATQ